MKAVSYSEAFADFYAWMKSRQQAGEIGQIPKDVQEARYAAEGLRRYPLGAKRIEHLLERYAPGRYEFRAVVIIHE